LPSTAHASEQYALRVVMVEQMRHPMVRGSGLALMILGLPSNTGQGMSGRTLTRLPVRHSTSIHPALPLLHALQHGTRLPS